MPEIAAARVGWGAGENARTVNSDSSASLSGLRKLSLQGDLTEVASGRTQPHARESPFLPLGPDMPT